MTELSQFLQRGVKVLAHRVVGVIMKTLVLPERVRGRRHVRLSSATTAQLRDMPSEFGILTVSSAAYRRYIAD